MSVDATLTLQDVSLVVREQYDKKYYIQTQRMGGATLQMLKYETLKFGSDGKTFQSETERYDTFRGDTNSISDFSAPGQFTPRNLKVRWNENTPSSNDFLKISGSGQLTEYAVNGANNDDLAIVSLSNKIAKDMAEDHAEKRAWYMSVPRSAKLLLNNGTRKNNDSNLFASCTTYTTGSTTMRAQVDGGSLAFIKEGVSYDFYTSAGVLHFSGARCTDVNLGDSSAAFTRNNSDSTANFDSIADNDVIYLSGSRNKGMWSPEAWFSAATAGESFIGGVDRTTSSYQWLNTITKSAGTSRQIRLTDFGDLCTAIGYYKDGERILVATSTPEITETLRRLIGDAAFVPWTQVGEKTQKRYASFGMLGLNYQHPVVGMMVIASDVMAPQDKVRLFEPETWRSLQYGKAGLTFMNGDNGIWTRQQSTVAGNGGSMIYRAEAYSNEATFCTIPKKNAQLTDVTA